MGDGAIAELAAEGIDVSGVARVDAPTGVALIVVDNAGENQIAVASGANTALTPNHATTALDARLAPAAAPPPAPSAPAPAAPPPPPSAPAAAPPPPPAAAPPAPAAS